MRTRRVKTTLKTVSLCFNQLPASLVYITAAGLSVPGIFLLTIGAGATFGFLTGFFPVSFAATVATLAFL